MKTKLLFPYFGKAGADGVCYRGSGQHWGISLNFELISLPFMKGTSLLVTRIMTAAAINMRWVLTTF